MNPIPAAVQFFDIRNIHCLAVSGYNFLCGQQYDIDEGRTSYGSLHHFRMMMDKVSVKGRLCKGCVAAVQRGMV
jgi:hypothetical protein